MINAQRNQGRVPLFAGFFSASLSLLLGCGAVNDGASGGAEAEAGRFGLLEFEASPITPPAAGPNGFHITLREMETGEPFTGAALRAVAIMPSMGHEAPDSVEIEEPGGGLYAVENLVFSMPGTWEVRYRAEREALVDEAAFTYEVR